MLKGVAPFVVGAAAYGLLLPLGADRATVGAIFAFTVALWITELLPIAITALVSSVLLIAVGKVPEKTVFAAYGDPIIPLFIGSFILAKAMETTGLGDRFALAILRKPWANRSPKTLLLALGVTSCVISLLVTNTAVTAMMVPIGLSILAAIGSRTTDSPYAIGVMLMLTWGSSVAVGMPVGTPPNLIGIAQIETATGVRIGFGQWMAFGMPITAVVMAACWGILWRLYGRNAPRTLEAGESARVQLAALGPMKRSEIVVLAAFSVAFILWTVPDSLEAILGKANPIATWAVSRIPASVAALAGVAIVFAVPVSDTESGRAITWREATTIDWGTILLFGAGIALGQALVSTGLAKELGEIAARATGATSLLAITTLCTAAAIILSELASNTAAATTMAPISIGLAQGAGVSPIAPTLGAVIGASFGFMLPVSTAPNAIVYSTGLVPSREMLKSGILLDVISLVVIVTMLMLILPMMGLA